MTINMVLYNPEIPQNTGNIIRSCAAANAKLHLIKPLGFSLDEKNIKRSAVNHIEDIELFVYENWEDFLNKNQDCELVFLTRYGKNPPTNHNFSDIQKNYYLVLGSESAGIPKELLKNHLHNCYRLPMSIKVRSLNLSNVAAIMLYEVLRQQDYYSLSKVEVQKGADWLTE